MVCIAVGLRLINKSDNNVNSFFLHLLNKYQGCLNLKREKHTTGCDRALLSGHQCVSV